MKDRFGDDIKPGERAQISLLPGPYPYSGFGWEGGPHEDIGPDVSMAWETSTMSLETVWLYFYEHGDGVTRPPVLILDELILDELTKTN